MDKLSRLDLVFCVDLTGSMSPFIQAARAQMTSILDALRAQLGDGLRVGVVAYRDHCDGKKVCEKHDFMGDLRAVKATLDGLQILGGGDYPEAVFTGLDACVKLPWRDGAYRVIVLVGDAPPHGCGAAGDSHAKGDPSGFDLDAMANLLEEKGLFVHALAMFNTPQPEPVLDRTFRRLSITTGGAYHEARGATAAMKIVESVSGRFLSELAFDRALFAAIDGAFPKDVEKLAKHLRASVDDVNAGMMRLRQRRLLDS